MGCAFLSPSLSSYRFYISDPQKSERPWESITNAVVVSEYGHLWRKKIHQLVTPVTEITPCSVQKHPSLGHSNVEKHLLVQRNLSCISKSSCERFGKVWHCEFCLVNEFAGGQAFGCVFSKKISLTKMNIVGTYSQSGRKKFGYV
jgi:hypothetical protein